MKTILSALLFLAFFTSQSQIILGGDVSTLRHVGLYNQNKTFMTGYGLSLGFENRDMIYFGRYSHYTIGSFEMESEVYALDANTTPQTILGSFRVRPTIFDANFGVERELLRSDNDLWTLFAQTSGGLQYQYFEILPQFSTSVYNNPYTFGIVEPTIRVYTQLGIGGKYQYQGYELFGQVDIAMMDNLFGFFYSAGTELFFEGRAGIKKTLYFGKNKSSSNDDEDE